MPWSAPLFKDEVTHLFTQDAYKTLQFSVHCFSSLAIVYFLYRTGKTFEFSLRAGGLPLWGLKASYWANSCFWNDLLVTCPWHHRTCPAAARVLMCNCLFAVFLENCAVARDKKWCRSITGGSLSLVKAGDTKDQTCFPKAVSPQRYQLQSRSTTIHHTATQELVLWWSPSLVCKYTGLAPDFSCIAGSKNLRGCLPVKRQLHWVCSLWSTN